MLKKVLLYTVLFSSLLSANAFAAVDDETAYALNTLLFLISGFLVMWMAAGTIISIHGKKRYVGENSYVLIHELRSGCWGKLAYIDDTYKNCIKVQEHINNIYLTKTKITKKMLNNLLIKDIQFNSKETIKMGVADEIYRG